MAIQKYLYKCLFCTLPFSILPIQHAVAEHVSPDEETDFISSMSLENLLNLELTKLGSRRESRSAIDAPAPLHVVSQRELRAQGNTNTLDTLSALVPTFNVSRESISDAGTLMRPANVRGLSADSTLYLVNGKRRHKSAVIGEYIAGINKGAQPTDLVPLFTSGLKQVEFLKDGAAAQYGSDAIAGVINFKLVDDPDAHELFIQGGVYNHESGLNEVTIGGVFGTHLGQDGFATLAFETKEAEPTSLGSQDPQAIALVDAGNTAVKNPVVDWGNPKIDNEIKLIFNASVEAGDNKELYAFGNWAIRDVDGSFFYRNPNTRQGVFVLGDERLRFDLDLTDAEDCSSVSVNADGTVHDPNGLTNTANPAQADCFLYNQWFQGGFTPRFGGQIIDASFVTGIKGTLKDGGSYDVSVSAGRNEIEYRIANTVNASYGPDSPTEFDLGGQVEFENLINLDFTHPVPVGLASDLNIAYGLQYHQEHFQMIAGQTESWEAGGFESQGALIGANGFQGFSSDFSGKFERDSFAVYTDLEIDVTDHWLTGMAFRLEKFSDFGSTFDGKLSNRYKFTDQFSLRSTISTGFRAPSIGQSNLQRAATSYDSGQLTSSLTVPPTEGAVSILSNNDIINNFNQTQGLSGDAAVVALDAKPLDPEESINASLGTIFKWDTYKLSVDYYRIQVDGRISLRSNIPLSDNQRTILENAGVKGSSELFSLAFFTNSLDSTTEGLDVMFSNELNYGSAGQGLLSLYANYNSTKIDDYIDSFVQTGEGQPLSDERKANLITEIERGVPDFRANVSYLHSYRHFDGLVRVNYYSETFELLLNEQCCAIKTDPLFTIDAETAWSFRADTHHAVQVAVGAKNLFDVQPEKHIYAGDSGWLGADYPPKHPAGFNGALYYVRFNMDI